MTRRRGAFAAHLFVVGLVLASSAWIATDASKRLVRVPRLLEWAELFHHPDDAALLMYVASGVAAFAWGLFLYVRLRPPAFRVLRALRRTAVARSVPLLAAVAGCQALVVFPALPRGLRIALAAGSMIACAVRPPARTGASAPLARAARALRLAALRAGKRGATALYVTAAAGLLVAISVEPVRLAMGPVRLLNEYPFLEERPAAHEGAGAVPVAGFGYGRCDFARTNPTEYALQSMSRGQMNHIGHVLNPLNERATGKPSEDTYFQYGVGATFAFEWVMDLFGGPSIQAYYKSLLLFVAYGLVFAASALVLLRDARYLLAAVGLLAAAHYGLGYQALLLAPGINPVLHFLDLPILLALLPFFRGGRWGPLVLAGGGAAAAVALNPLFGSVAAMALCVAAAMYLVENRPRGGRVRPIAALAALVAGPIAAVVLVLPRTGGGAITSHFLSGFFSWRPSPWLVLLTLAYLAGSYLFLVWTRDLRDPLKYAVVYLFVYAQGYLLYFYWSGLENHFWPALPYLGLHLLLMVRMLARGSWGTAWERRLLLGAAIAIAFVTKIGVDGFVAERKAVSKVFARWETHAWPFPRARVVSTIDPAPIAASLVQIDRYSSPEDRGICMVSVLDNLIPFLAARHSIFPHFDLQWALLTDRERRRVLGIVATVRPRYVFVGREVEAHVAGDVWDPPCGMEREVESARGRVDELRRVLDAISADYERIETGPLLSVYRRRATSL